VVGDECDYYFHPSAGFFRLQCCVSLLLLEWIGVRSRPIRLLWAGILVIIAAANLVGLGMAS
jgi:L-rhamnose-H+ transport protein